MRKLRSLSFEAFYCTNRRAHADHSQSAGVKTRTKCGPTGCVFLSSPGLFYPLPLVGWIPFPTTCKFSCQPKLATVKSFLCGSETLCLTLWSVCVRAGRAVWKAIGAHRRRHPHARHCACWQRPEIFPLSWVGHSGLVFASL
jgi:hypothetical protein